MVEKDVAQECHYLSAFVFVLSRVSPQRSGTAVSGSLGTGLYVRSNMGSESGHHTLSISLASGRILSFNKYAGH